MDPSYLKERESFILRAASEIDKGRYGQAKNAAEERLDRYPGDVDAWLVLAACFVREQRYTEAQAILNELDRILPGWPHIYECLGDLYRNRKMAAEAQEFYRKALNPDRDLRERIAAKMAALVSGPEGNGASVDRERESLIASNFHTVTLAELYLSQGHIDKARDVVGKILEEDPAHPEAHRVMNRINAAKTPRHASVIAQLDRWLMKLGQMRNPDE